MRRAIAMSLILAALAIHGTWDARAGTPTQEAFSAADEAAIHEASARYEAASEADDMERMADLIAEDAVYMVPNVPLLEGRAAALDFFGANATVELNLTIQEIFGRLDLAVVRGSYTVSFTTPEGQAVEDRGKYVEIWQRQEDGAWRIVRDIWNSDLPVAGAVADP